VVEETDLPQVTDVLYHLTEHTLPWAGFELTPLAVKSTDCIGSCKSNYYTITTTTAPEHFWDLYWYVYVSKVQIHNWWLL